MMVREAVLVVFQEAVREGMVEEENPHDTL